MEQRVTFITLGVKDIQSSVDFYENKFGWKRSEMSNDNLIVYSLNGFYLALYAKEELAKDACISPQGEGFRGFTLSHNVWSEQEVNDLILLFRKEGVPIIKEPQKVFWGGYSSYVADPDGNLWEIAFNPYLEKQ
ncbi:MAG TPA: VOC family protein [Prolixibacteraceae bacterium]|nr:VOC family protein [Prolixibacteraceae bacterium]